MKKSTIAEGRATTTRQGVLPFLPASGSEEAGQAASRQSPRPDKESADGDMKRGDKPFGVPRVEKTAAQPPTWSGDSEQGEGWTVVTGRHKKMNKLESRTLVVWGVRQDRPASEVHSCFVRLL